VTAQYEMDNANIYKNIQNQNQNQNVNTGIWGKDKLSSYSTSNGTNNQRLSSFTTSSLCDSSYSAHKGRELNK